MQLSALKGVSMRVPDAAEVILEWSTFHWRAKLLLNGVEEFNVTMVASKYV